MDKVNEDVLKVSDVAVMLQLHENTVLKLLNEGKLPGVKIGKSWRCSREEILAVLRSGNPLTIESKVNVKPEAIHQWFNLTYASYLVIPRVVLQSMPDDWQCQFVDLLNEMNDSIDWASKEYGDNYAVFLRDRTGRFVKDELSLYQRGRRRLPLKSNLKKESK